jgi:hypothetical protein
MLKSASIEILQQESAKKIGKHKTKMENLKILGVKKINMAKLRHKDHSDAK